MKQEKAGRDMGFFKRRMTQKIQEIIDITKTATVLTLDELEFPSLGSSIDDDTKQKLFILAINDVFGEETDPSKNNLRATNPELVNEHLESIKRRMLDECSPFLREAIRLKAFAIGKNVSDLHARAYMALASKYFPSPVQVPTKREAKALIRSWKVMITRVT